MQIHIIIKVQDSDLIVGVSLEKLGKVDEAIIMYDGALYINPNHENSYYNKGTKSRFLGVLFENLGKFDEAIKMYDRAL